MRYTIFKCCPTALFLETCETAIREILARLGVDLAAFDGFGCCGYPLRNVNFKAYVLCSARDMALAERHRVSILTFCNCCFGSLKHARHFLAQDPALREEINRTLAKEGLEYTGRAVVKHLLEVFYQDVGPEAIGRKLGPRYEGLKVATHYGCHLLRPSPVVQFDDPVNPVVFDRLVQATGAGSVPWRAKLDCCGSPSWGIYDQISINMTKYKITDASESGADCLCLACPFCYLHFNQVIEVSRSNGGTIPPMPIFLYTQLLGLGLGLEPAAVGLSPEQTDVLYKVVLKK
ncbi:MAG: CoB--CoM heterodisulfide reductase iron-sulfur subunit B family protein [Thermodesulfobacteriota bacterium]